MNFNSQLNLADTLKKPSMSITCGYVSAMATSVIIIVSLVNFSEILRNKWIWMNARELCKNLVLQNWELDVELLSQMEFFSDLKFEVI